VRGSRRRASFSCEARLAAQCSAMRRGMTEKEGQ